MVGHDNGYEASGGGLMMDGGCSGIYVGGCGCRDGGCNGVCGIIIPVAAMVARQLVDSCGDYCKCCAC